MKHDVEYLNLLRHILRQGRVKSDRTGTGTASVFGYQMRFPLSTHFPLLTTKKVHTRSIIYELLWFLNGDTNIKYLKDNGVSIWDEWADENGDLGPIYGSQWRTWPTNEGSHIDQIANVMQSLQNNPFSRRHIVSAWNPSQVDSMAIPPCHTMFQFYVDELSLYERVELYKTMQSRGEAPECDLSDSEQSVQDKLTAMSVPTLRLSCQLYQRSADTFLGIPFNIASYSLLTHMVAQQLGYAVGDFVHTLGDAHIYSNHMEQALTQLARTPKESPVLRLRKAPSLFEYTFEDFEFLGYDPDPAIKAPVAV